MAKWDKPPKVFENDQDKILQDVQTQTKPGNDQPHSGGQTKREVYGGRSSGETGGIAPADSRKNI